MCPGSFMPSVYIWRPFYILHLFPIASLKRMNGQFKRLTTVEMNKERFPLCLELKVKICPLTSINGSIILNLYDQDLKRCRQYDIHHCMA